MKNNKSGAKKSIKLILIILFPVSVFLSDQVNAQAKQWVAPPAATSIKNPLAGDVAAVNEGKILYTTNCTPCHGNKGKGDGPAAAALNPKPADHTSPAMLNETDGSLFYKISEGHTPMPQYKATLTDKQRWELVDYIRTLCKVQKR